MTPSVHLRPLFAALALMAVVVSGSLAALDSGAAQNSGATRSVALEQGWNLVGWTGPTLAVEQALDPILDAVDVAFGWSATAQSFERYSPTSPAALNSLEQLQSGAALWLCLDHSLDWEQPADIDGSRDVTALAGASSRGFDLQIWTGPDGTPIASALADLLPALELAHAWDAAQQRFLSFGPSRFDFLNTLDSLDHGDAVWLDLHSERVWRQPAPEVEAEPLRYRPGLDTTWQWQLQGSLNSS